MGLRDDLVAAHGEDAVEAFERCYGDGDANEEIFNNFTAAYIGQFADDEGFETAEEGTAGPIDLVVGTDSQGWVCRQCGDGGYFESGGHYFRNF